MTSRYQSAVEHLYALGHELATLPSHKFDLEHVRVLLTSLGDPHRRFPSVLIAGTNGKGSTAATLASILRCAGHRTGLYTSPHLLRINERLQIDGQPISDPDFAEMHNRIDQSAELLVATGSLPWHPSFFEMLTAMAFEYFAEAGIQIAVLEVGMGGRLDATNVVEPLLSVVTDIALDHQKFLGNTLAEIAREKAGIIRPGGVVVTLPQHPEANDVLGNTILERGARAVSAVPYVPPVSPGAAQFPQDTPTAAGSDAASEHARREGTTSVVPNAQFPQDVPAASREGTPSLLPNAASDRVSREGTTSVVPNVAQEAAALAAEGLLRARYRLNVLGAEIQVDSPLVGRHQLRNLALAVAAAEQLSSLGFPLTARDVERGIRETRWPGRFQVVARRGVWPELVLDVAHNPAGAWALRSTLSAHYEGRPLVLLFGALRDKAIGEMAEVLFPLAERVVLTRADNPRAATPEQIRQAAARVPAEVEFESTVAGALNRARALAADLGEDAVVVITGSIYLVGEVMARLHAAAAQ